ncbi:MAG: DegT/DnrJ/EryC1/StrS family aminotransferase [Actinomycetales bacterium]|nr:DegT/DnrJ/EryC1/StrS family aminotransferase [Actinomycetales bacterium]
MDVPFFRADLDGHELEYIREVLRSGWLTSGPRVQQFEEAFAAAVGARHAIAVNSCTAALHLACEAAGVDVGSEVLVPSLTFTATAEVVDYLGGRVRLVDVDPTTGLLTPDLLEEALDAHPSISSVMPVHFAGAPCRMLGRPGEPGIVDICHARGISIVEDAAHAFTGGYENGRPIGSSIGTTACCFSFYASKAITTGEGGMVTTNDDAVAERMRRMRLHGIDRSAWDRQVRIGAAWEYDVVETGYKYNLTDIAAAIGLAQLERSQEFRVARARLFKAYHERLGSIDALRLPPFHQTPSQHAWHLFVIRVDPASGIERDQLIEEINARGVGTSVHYKPLHRMTHWSKTALQAPSGYPSADAWFEHCVSLPLFPSMTPAEFDLVCTAVESAVTNCLADVSHRS